jgi:protein ImuB
MSRMACVNIPSFSLQLLSHREPQWLDHPVAVVTEEKPMGIILEINKNAKERGVQTGMRFSAALTLAPDLHAAAVSEHEIQDGIGTVLKILLDFSPEVEPFELNPGIFWVNAVGFTRLYGDLESWAAQLQETLDVQSFVSRMSIGFSRFGSFLAAKRAKHPIIFQTTEEEMKYARYTPLTLLPMSPKASHQLKDLGIETVGAFIDLPSGGVKKRFSKDVCHWYRFASDHDPNPIQPTELREEFILSKKFQPEIKSIKPVLLHFKTLLDHLLTDVMKHNELVHSLRFTLSLEEGEDLCESVTPSRPTVRPDTLFRLLNLRLSGIKLTSSILMIEISAERVGQKGAQELLFHEEVSRDLAKGAEAFALIRAELGNNAVQYAEIRNEYLPEDRVRWIDAKTPQRARGAAEKADFENSPKLVRRMYRSHKELATLPSRQVKIKAGPVRFDTSWWETGVSRDYYYIEDQKGSLHWVYRNRENNMWGFQGFVS